MGDKDTVATSDFTLAAVLLVNGFRLRGTAPDTLDPRRRRRFVFEGDASAFTRLTRDLMLDDVLVPARAFALAQRRLKRVLYDMGGTTNAGEGRP